MITEAIAQKAVIKKTFGVLALVCALAVMVFAASGCGYVVAAGAGGAAGYAVGRGQSDGD